MSNRTSCPNCSEINLPTSAYCVSCGTSLRTGKYTLEQNERIRKKPAESLPTAKELIANQVDSDTLVITKPRLAHILRIPLILFFVAFFSAIPSLIVVLFIQGELTPSSLFEWIISILPMVILVPPAILMLVRLVQTLKIVIFGEKFKLDRTQGIIRKNNKVFAKFDQVIAVIVKTLEEKGKYSSTWWHILFLAMDPQVTGIDESVDSDEVTLKLRVKLFEIGRSESLDEIRPVAYALADLIGVEVKDN